MSQFQTDIVLINPGDRKQTFQGLGLEAAGVEPPFWIISVAAYLRNKGFQVAIIDTNAENITAEETATRVREYSPRLSAVIVYGGQPSASTQNMPAAGKICKALKSLPGKIAIGGLHPSALPELTLREECVDFVIDGEGIITLEQLLLTLRNDGRNYYDIPGLWWWEEGSAVHTERPPLINNLDLYLPVGAWDLLPMHLYRAHNWHCFDDIAHRQPYAAIYTSLGCPFNCAFCCINAPFGKPGIRFRSPEIVLDEIELLAKTYSVRNLKIIDELFVLKEDHYMKICDGIIRRGLNLNIWAYARVDTVKSGNLELMKKAGINWLALGIESANPKVRDGATKNMRVKEIKEIVGSIQSHGIRVIGNYIFGLPDDTLDTMRETLDMALDLNCEFANFYSAMAYPGSKLYYSAVQEGLELPTCWGGFSQHAYDTLPLANKNLSATEILKFRDNAFMEYFTNQNYLAILKQKFGMEVREHIESIASIKLKRKLYD